METASCPFVNKRAGLLKRSYQIVGIVRFYDWKVLLVLSQTMEGI